MSIRKMMTAAALVPLLALGLGACAGSGSESNPAAQVGSGAIEQVGGSPETASIGATYGYGAITVEPLGDLEDQVVATWVSGSADNRWIGQGPAGACGNPWAMDLEILGQKVSGKLWLSEIEYDLYGRLGSDGRMQRAQAGKTPRHAHSPGPRFLEVNLLFQGAKADGDYAVAAFDRRMCATQVSLTKL